MAECEACEERHACTHRCLQCAQDLCAAAARAHVRFACSRSHTIEPLQAPVSAATATAEDGSPALAQWVARGALVDLLDGAGEWLPARAVDDPAAATAAAEQRFHFCGWPHRFDERVRARDLERRVAPFRSRTGRHDARVGLPFFVNQPVEVAAHAGSGHRARTGAVLALVDRRVGVNVRQGGGAPCVVEWFDMDSPLLRPLPKPDVDGGALRVGDKFDVLDTTQVWLVGCVRSVHAGGGVRAGGPLPIFVHYVDYPDRWDEWLDLAPGGAGHKRVAPLGFFTGAPRTTEFRKFDSVRVRQGAPWEEVGEWAGGLVVQVVGSMVEVQLDKRRPDERDGRFELQWVEGHSPQLLRLPLDGLAAGDALDALTEDEEWLPATAARREGDRILVHYDGWEDDCDEWLDIASGRVAAAGVFTSAPHCDRFHVGQPVAFVAAEREGEWQRGRVRQVVRFRVCVRADAGGAPLWFCTASDNVKPA